MLTHVETTRISTIVPMAPALPDTCSEAEPPTTTFVSPMPKHVTLGHLTLMNDQEAFLQAFDAGMRSYYETEYQEQPMTAQALLNDLLETLEEDEVTSFAWRVGFLTGEIAGMLNPEIAQADGDTSCLEVLTRKSQMLYPGPERVSTHLQAIYQAVGMHLTDVEIVPSAHSRLCVPSPEIASAPQQQSQQQDPVYQNLSASSYRIGPIDREQLVAIGAPCSGGEQCPLLIPKPFPLWILNHPEFRDGYEQNYFGEVVKDDPDDRQWSAVPRMINLIYEKLVGKDFAGYTGEVEPAFGPWEIGFLLRDFTRLATTDRVLALTGIAHLNFLVSFLPTEHSTYWPPVGLLRARFWHDQAMKAYRGRVRTYRERGKSFAEAQRLALASQVK